MHMYTYMHNIVCKSEIYTYYMCVYVCEREREGGTDVLALVCIWRSEDSVDCQSVFVFYLF